MNERVGRTLDSGAGSFVYVDAVSRVRLQVFYYRPQTLFKNRPILFVMHGVKRNAQQYRDSWIPYAQQFGTFLVAPQFSEKCFPGWKGYNLGGLTDNGMPPNASAFAVLERLFDYIRHASACAPNYYLIYGHSAGAQFVHRLVLLHERNRAHIAIAANAGWYTLPTFETEYPYGLANSPCRNVDLRGAFRKRLVILLGKSDTDENDENLRRTNEAMMQGVHRLQRGQNKFQVAKSMASYIGTEFRWEMKVVPEVGHSNRAIAKKAAKILFA